MLRLTRQNSAGLVWIAVGPVFWAVSTMQRVLARPAGRWTVVLGTGAAWAAQPDWGSLQISMHDLVALAGAAHAIACFGRRMVIRKTRGRPLHSTVGPCVALVLLGIVTFAVGVVLSQTTVDHELVRRGAVLIAVGHIMSFCGETAREAAKTFGMLNRR